VASLLELGLWGPELLSFSASSISAFSVSLTPALWHPHGDFFFSNL
jgi:hypothetical protein